MGICASSSSTGYQREIDERMLVSDKVESAKKKLLFLGSGSAGKSTLFKQLTRIYIEDKFDDSVKLDTLTTIRNNCVEQMLKLLMKQDELMDMQLLPPLEHYVDEGKCDMKLTVTHGAVLAKFDNFLTDDSEEISPSDLYSIGLAIEFFWSLESVRLTHSLRFGRFSFKENMDVFFDKVVDVFKPDYEVTTDDILMVRLRTTGIIERDFTMMERTVSVVDVGGQRSERQKWIHLFSGIDAILFVAALNHYNCVTFEDENVNCMHDSLQLFDESINHKVLRLKDVILFLNKVDLFVRLLASGSSLSVCFGLDTEGWEGPEFWDREPPQQRASLYDYSPQKAAAMEETERNTYFNECYAEAMEFIEERYKDRNMTTLRAVFVHPTTAVDKNNVQKVFWDVQNVAVRDGLFVSGVFE